MNDTLLSEEDRRRLERYLPEQGELDEEEARLLALPEEKQRKVLDRLAKIDEYLLTPKPGPGRTAAAAQDLGMSPRNLYRLISKLRSHGAVAALAPNLQVKKRPAVARDGLGPVAEQALATLLLHEPDARWARAVEVVENAPGICEEGVPSMSAVRRRLLALRAAGNSNGVEAPQFGETIIVDQTFLDLPMQTSAGVRYSLVTLIVDRSSRLILGSGISDPQLPQGGLYLAISRALKKLPGVAGTDLPLATRLGAVQWVVADGLERLVQGVRNHAESAYPNIQLEVDERGTRRHGARLLRLIGDRLGPYQLMIRWSTELPPVPGSTSPAPVPGQKAEELIELAVRSWNSLVLEAHKVGPTSRTLAARKRKLHGFGDRLIGLFSPVIGEDFRVSLENIQSSKLHRGRTPQAKKSR